MHFYCVFTLTVDIFWLNKKCIVYRLSPTLYCHCSAASPALKKWGGPKKYFTFFFIPGYALLPHPPLKVGSQRDLL